MGGFQNLQQNNGMMADIHNGMMADIHNYLM
jgi:hypothetical protein